MDEIGFGLSWTTRRPLDIEFGIGLVADGWLEIDGRQEGLMRLSLELMLMYGLRLINDRKAL